MKYLNILFAMLLMNIFCVAQETSKGKIVVQFQFQNRVGSTLLQRDTTYTNPFGERYKVRSFKYYISHLQLNYKSGKTYDLNLPPHLVNEEDSSSKLIAATVPAGIVTSIHFLLGIDSATSVSGVQTGDLDPAKGMFWIWNTGYIMAKLEGTSPSSKAPGKSFSYDIGGYKWGENAARDIMLSTSVYQLKKQSLFIVSADINTWFNGANSIKIGEQPMCHTPGMLAMQIAGNYAGMFSIQCR